MHAYGVNPVVATSLYKKIVLPCLMYGSELWNNLRQQDHTELNKLQHHVVKKIQGFEITVRSDMCESMVGLNPITAEIDKLLTLKPASISKQIFIRKMYMFLTGRPIPQTGFIPDICNILSKYHLCDFLNQFLQTLNVPTPSHFKRLIKTTLFDTEVAAWRNRVNQCGDYVRFKNLHQRIETAVIYTLRRPARNANTIRHIARLWVMKPTNMSMCPDCEGLVTDRLYHTIFGCQITSRKTSLFLQQLTISFPAIVRHLPFTDGEAMLHILLGKMPEIDVEEEHLSLFTNTCFDFIQNMTSSFFG